MTSYCYIDVETQSELDLRKVGMFRYAEDPSSRILCMAFAFDKGPIECVADLGEIQKVIEYVARSGSVLVSHNNDAEQCMLERAIGQWVLDIDWLDTAACAARMGLPRKLEELLLFFWPDDPECQKDMAGNKVMLKLCAPRKGTKVGDADRFWTPKTARKNFERLYEYCKADVRGMRKAHQEKLINLEESEEAVRQLTYRMNRRGVKLDTKLLPVAQEFSSKHETVLTAEFTKLAHCLPKSPVKVAGYLGLPDATKPTVRKALRDSNFTGDRRRVLGLLQKLSGSARSKLEAMANRVSLDGRLRGALVYSGSERTQRFSSWGVQLQNMKRGLGKGTDLAFAALEHGVLEEMYDGSTERPPPDPALDPLSVVGEMMRGFLTGPFTVGDFCLAPNTRLLHTNMTWRPIRDTKVGDELVGFDEAVTGKPDEYTNKKYRSKFRRSKVEAVKRLQKKCVRIITDRGTVVASTDHMWLARTARLHHWSFRHREWVKTEDLQLGDRISFFVNPWETDKSFEAGYLAGFFDGEGWLTYARVGFAQNEGPTLRRVLRLLDCKGFKLSCSGYKRKCQGYTFKSDDAIRFIGSVRPQRLLKDAWRLWEGLMTWGQNSTPATVMALEPCGTQNVVAVQTSTHTFVAEGFLSHNCQIECRVAGWYAGQEDLLEAFRAKGDPYCDIASKIYGRTITKVDKMERFMGKQVRLGCLAEGTGVWCKRDDGKTFWRPIEYVTRDLKVWDGMEWVRHAGVVAQGRKPVVEWRNVQLTADHLVMVEENEFVSAKSLPHTDRGSSSDTYDITFAGPRSRFTIGTRDGPAIVHNCGYQMGHKRFRTMLDDIYDVQISEDFAKKVIGIYRESSSNIVKLWETLMSGFRYAIGSHSKHIKVGPVFMGTREIGGEPFAFIEMPNKRRLWYAHPELHGPKAEVRYFGRDIYRGGAWGMVSTHGGKILENITQALSRDLLTDAMLRLDAAGFPIVLTVHDEVVAEYDPDRSIDEFKSLMEVVPEYAQGLPIEAECLNTFRYRK